MPCSNHTNNKVEVCDNAEGLKVVAARNTNIHTHAAITDVLIVRQYGKNMSSHMSKMSDMQQMLDLEASSLGQAEQPRCTNIRSVIVKYIDHILNRESIK